MMTWLLYIVALAVIVAVLTFVLGRVMGRGEIMPEFVDNQSVQNLNRRALENREYDDIRFDTVVRGYRQDQVDAVLEHLMAEIAELRAQDAGNAARKAETAQQ